MTLGVGPSALYYEQFGIGNRWRSPCRTITETDGLMFAGLSGDMGALCFDAGSSVGKSPRKRSVNAPSALALATGLEQRLGLKEGTGIAFMAATWTRHQPLLAGDTVRIEQQVIGKRTTTNEARGIVIFDVRLLNARDELHYRGKWTLMMSRNPAPEEAPSDALSGGAGGYGIGSASDLDLADCDDANGIGKNWTTPSRTITGADIAYFCALTGDYNPAHSDVEFARSSIFGERILQGPAGLAIGVGLASRLDLGALDLGADMEVVAANWTFKAPILAGDTLRVDLTVLRRSASGALFSAVILNQRCQPVQQGDWLMTAR